MVANSSNPVLAESGLPYDLPDFAAISDEDFLPAFDAAMAAQLAEVDAIAAGPQPPTFADTVEALELSGRELARAAGVFYNLVGPDTNPRRNEISQELSTRLTEHGNAIAMNPALFARISDLHARADDLGLTEPQRRLLDRQYRDAVRAGAALDADGQQQMREISSRLAYLTTRFGQLILDDTNASAVLFEDADELSGLSAAELDAARRAAAAAGHDTGYLITLELPTSQSVLIALDRPDARARIMSAAMQRCARGNEYDTRALVLEIVRLRARAARLLGYRDHAEYVIAEQTAPDAEAVEKLLGELSAAAGRASEREIARLREFAGSGAAEVPLGPADVTYWLEREKRSRAAVPLDGFRDYCELDTVLTDGVFHAAGVLYGLSFTERPDLQAYHPDVRVWAVHDEDGTGLGLFLGDYFARPSKRGGAWMNNIVDQSTALRSRPVIVNVLNLTKPAPGEPCLLSVDELTTLFHEFGHALHGLLSAVDYPSQSGTSVPRDFVEFPSQVNEMWALHPEVLANYARHHVSGAPIPPELAGAARDLAGAESAHGTVEYLAAATLDLAWHRLTEAEAAEIEAAGIEDVADFERRALTGRGFDTDLIPPRYRSSYFNHIFGGGYSAGYYSYIWSEVLDAETEQWFLAEGGLRRDSGRRFAAATLSKGDSQDPLVSHAALIGRTPSVGPLLTRRGLAESA